jgi:hypothetical protein
MQKGNAMHIAFIPAWQMLLKIDLNNSPDDDDDEEEPSRS